MKELEKRILVNGRANARSFTNSQFIEWKFENWQMLIQIPQLPVHPRIEPPINAPG
jgi:hypothetical protein